MVMFLVSFSSYLRMTEGAYMVLLHMSPAQISKDVFNRLATHLSVDIRVPTLASLRSSVVLCPNIKMVTRRPKV